MLKKYLNGNLNVIAVNILNKTISCLCLLVKHTNTSNEGVFIKFIAFFFRNKIIKHMNTSNLVVKLICYPFIWVARGVILLFDKRCFIKFGAIN